MHRRPLLPRFHLMILKLGMVLNKIVKQRISIGTALSWDIFS